MNLRPKYLLIAFLLIAKSSFAQIAGTVFNDINANGVLNASTPIELGVAGVIVNIYDVTNTLSGTTTSAANGTYSINPSGTAPFRLEFVIPTSLNYLSFAPTAVTSGSSVRFLGSATQTGVNLALLDKSVYATSANPNVIGVRHNEGQITDANATENVILKAPYYSNGNSFTGASFALPAGATALATKAMVGTTFGLATQGSKGKVYASAYHKRYTGFGPNGPAAIYQLDTAGSTTVSGVINLSTLTGTPNVAGTDIHDFVARAQIGGGTEVFDLGPGGVGYDVLTSVGARSLGDITLDDNEKTLFVVNLFTKQIYALDVSTGIAANTTLQYTWNAPDATGGGTHRPFALKYYKGKLYVGSVNQNGSNAYVHSFNPNSSNPTFTLVLTIPLNYTRQAFIGNANQTGREANWNAWLLNATSVNAATLKGSASEKGYPQAMLTGLDFDANGNMIIGLGDRFGDQFGYQRRYLDTSSVDWYATSGGDMLKACVNTTGSAWTLEGGTACNTTNGLTNSGPGGTTQPEHYEWDMWGINNTWRVDTLNGGFHWETTQGAVLQLPGGADVISTSMNPTSDFSGGWVRFNNATGRREGINANNSGVPTTGGYTLFESGDFSNAYPAANGTFAKANGLGDLELITATPPIEIGNRVWRDNDFDGIQDANEPGIGNLTVLLFQGATQVGTTTTNTSGEYLFNNANVTGGLLPNTNYQIRIALAQTPLANLQVTALNNDPSANGDERDNDASGTTTAIIAVTTGEYGKSNYSYDFGFSEIPCNANITGLKINDLTGATTGFPIVNGGFYEISDFPSSYNLESILTGTAGSMQFNVSGPVSGTNIENVIPYNHPGTGNPWTGVVQGVYTVVQTAYTGSNASGPICDIDTTVFTICDANVIISGTPIVCNGSLASLTASGASIYLWSNGATSATVQLGAGTYTVTGTNSFGCTATSVITVQNIEGAIGNYIWTDINGNGIQDEGIAAGINGVTVELRDATTNALVISTSTANDVNGNPGYFSLPVCTSGDYYVKFPTTLGNNVLTSQTPTPAIDGNSDASPIDGNSPVITIDLNGTGINKNNNTIDAGYYELGSIGNFVWYDLNRNGIQDDRLDPNGTNLGAELPVANVKALLKNSAGIVIDSVLTNSNGLYYFSNLVPGNYSVTFDNTSFPSDSFVVTKLNAGTNDATDSDVDTLSFSTASFNLESAQNDSTIDMGIYRLGVPSIVDPCGCTDQYIYNPDGEVYRFSEVVAVSATPGGVWRVIDSNFATGVKTFGIFKASTPPDFFFVAGFPVGDALVEVSPGKYTYSFYHRAAVGYAVVVTDGIDTLDISASCTSDSPVYDTSINNLCYYGGPYIMQDTFTGGTVQYYLLQDSAFSYMPNFNEYTLIAGKPQITQINPQDYPIGSTIALYMLWTPTPGLPGNNCPRAQFINISFSLDSAKCLSGLGNYAWYDNNKNGLQDSIMDPNTGLNVSPELPVSNLLVELRKSSNDSLIATTTTDSNGYYLFTKLIPDNYYVQTPTLPDSFKLTKLTSGNTVFDNNIDSATLKSSGINLEVGYFDTTIDIGLTKKAIPTIGDPCTCHDILFFRGETYEVLDKLLITSNPGAIWTIFNQTGMELIDTFLELTLPLGTIVPEDSAGYYSLQFAHNSGQGYTVFVTDGTDTLTYSNLCNVAEMATSVDSLLNICGASNPVPLTGVVTKAGVTVPGNIIFSVVNHTLNDTLFNVTEFTPQLYNTDDSVSVLAFFTPTLPEDCPLKYSFNVEIDPRSNCYASVGDYVWNDLNKNGTQDSGEPGVSGVGVILYNSANEAVGYSTTDALGKYLFADLLPGNYSVGFTLPANYSFTTSTGTSSLDSLNSDVNEVTGRTSFTELLENEAERSMDAGIIFKEASTASVGDRVWFDSDNDGVQDAGEPGASNVLVALKDNSGNTVATVITDATGNYLFTDIMPGTYSVQFSNPIGTIFTTNTNNLVNGLNSDAAVNGSTVPFSVSAGDNITYIDAGIVLQGGNKASIGDKVWLDIDVDGNQDANEPGMQDVVVNLFAANGTTLLSTTTTDALGNYNFSNLDSGSYVVQFIAPANFDLTIPNAIGVNSISNSDANPATGKTVPVSLKLSERNATIDAGLIDLTVGDGILLGDKVWFDNNANGTQDATELGVPGVTVQLYVNGTDGVAGTSDDVKIAQTTTDENGNYIFANLNASASLASQYSVQFVNLPGGYSFTEPQVAATAQDSDPNPSTGRTSSINLLVNDLTIDAGIKLGKPAGKASLGDKIFADINNNGIQDAGELGVNQVSVTLYKDENNDGVISGLELTPIKTTTTDGLGNYNFTDLEAGAYQVGFGNLPVGYTLSPKNAGSNDALDSDGNPVASGVSKTDIIYLASGEDDLTVDLGLVPPANTNILGDFVWFDANADGLQSVGENGIPGVMVSLVNPVNQEVLATTVTNADGAYQFVGLADGNYSVQFSNLPEGFQFTTPSVTNTANGSDADIDGSTLAVTLNATNNVDFSLDAGLVSTRAALGNYVWMDINKNGLQDADEENVSGVTVTLFRPGFGLDGIAGNSDDAQPVAAAITDATGRYFFGNLDAGNYQLNFSTIPSAYVFTQQVNPGDNLDNTNSDVNPTTGSTMLVSLTAQEVDLSIDAGLAPIPTATVGDYVWFDKNKNGLQVSTEQAVPGVLATLFNASNIAVGAAVTDGNGKYLIRNVDPNAGYYISFNANITGFGTNGKPTWTTPNMGTNGAGTGTLTESNLDSDVSNTIGTSFGKTTAFTVQDGDNLRNIDGGIFVPITLSGNVWHDINGLSDTFVNNSGQLVVPAAAPIPVGLRAYLVNPATNTIVKTVIVSSATGIYNFGEISPSTNYYIILSNTPAANGSPVPLAKLPTGWENTGEKLGITKGSDGVINGRLNVPGSTENIVNANFGIRLKNGESVIP